MKNRQAMVVALGVVLACIGAVFTLMTFGLIINSPLVMSRYLPGIALGLFIFGVAIGILRRKRV